MSDLIESLYEDLEAMASDGLIEKQTLREFEHKHLAYHSDLNGEDVKALRESNHISQAVLARYLNLSPVSIQRWEQGKSMPSGSAVVLLNLIKEKGLQALM